MDESSFNRSPWNIKKERFKLVKSAFQIKTTLEYIKKKHRLLSIYVEDSDIPQKSVLLRISKDTIQIDKPIHWQKAPKKFRIYFRDHSNTWNFINTQLEEEDVYKLSIPLPSELFRLKSRWHKRVNISSEANATLHFDDHSIVDMQILNLSASGMLVCSGTKKDQKILRSTVKAITIDISDKSMKQNSTVIDEGMIVRSYKNENSGQFCHGITFLHKDKNSLHDLREILT